MKYENAAAQIGSQLALAAPPVALAFVEAPPAGVRNFDQEVPSACTFWRKAETSVFYAPAEKHFNCPIGGMTMGFDMPGAVQENLMELVRKMFGCGYISPEETAKIPSIKKKKTGIVYGPLGNFPIEPDLILMWLTPSQAMLYSEAAGTCRWSDELPAMVFGRPSCAALPVAFGQSQSTLSLGCTGMRIFTDISENRLLAVLPADRLQEFLNGLGSITEANAAMREFYEGHKGKFAEARSV